MRHGENIKILSWNVRGLNCPINRGHVRQVLQNYFCDIAILQESKMEDVNNPIAIRLWGRRPVDWIFLPSIGRSEGIIVIWNTQVLELVDPKIGSYTVYCKFLVI